MIFANLYVIVFPIGRPHDTFAVFLSVAPRLAPVQTVRSAVTKRTIAPVVRISARRATIITARHSSLPRCPREAALPCSARSLGRATRLPVRTTRIARRPRARGRALSRVVDVAGAAFGVADRRCPRAVPVLVAARRL